MVYHRLSRDTPLLNNWQLKSWDELNVGSELERKLVISLDNATAIIDYSMEMTVGDVESFKTVLHQVARKVEVISIDTNEGAGQEAIIYGIDMYESSINSPKSYI